MSFDNQKVFRKAPATSLKIKPTLTSSICLTHRNNRLCSKLWLNNTGCMFLLDAGASRIALAFVCQFIKMKESDSKLSRRL